MTAVNSRLDFALVLRRDEIESTVATVREYDALTIGCPEEHLKALQNAMGFGNSVVAITLAEGKIREELYDTTAQVETLF